MFPLLLATDRLMPPQNTPTLERPTPSHLFQHHLHCALVSPQSPSHPLPAARAYPACCSLTRGPSGRCLPPRFCPSCKRTGPGHRPLQPGAGQPRPPGAGGSSGVPRVAPPSQPRPGPAPQGRSQLERSTVPAPQAVILPPVWPPSTARAVHTAQGLPLSPARTVYTT